MRGGSGRVVKNSIYRCSSPFVCVCVVMINTCTPVYTLAAVDHFKPGVSALQPPDPPTPEDKTRTHRRWFQTLNLHFCASDKMQDCPS